MAKKVSKKTTRGSSAEPEKRPSPTLDNPVTISDPHGPPPPPPHPPTLDAAKLDAAILGAYSRCASAGKLQLGYGGFAIEDFCAAVKAELVGFK